MNKLELIKKKALEDKVPILMDDTLEVIEKILINQKPSSILEIGAAVGYSAICFSKFLEVEGYIDTIEREENRKNEAVENIKEMGLEDKIHLYYGDAVEILPTMDKKYDVVFIDAAKGKYTFFLEQALRMLNDNGVIIADNVLYKGYVRSDYNAHKHRTAVRNLRNFLEILENNKELEVEVLEVGDGLAIARKNK